MGGTWAHFAGLGYIGTTGIGDAWFDDVVLLDLPPKAAPPDVSKDAR
jgi:hypothetical protein